MSARCALSALLAVQAGTVPACGMDPAGPAIRNADPTHPPDFPWALAAAFVASLRLPGRREVSRRVHGSSSWGCWQRAGGEEVSKAGDEEHGR